MGSGWEIFAARPNDVHGFGADVGIGEGGGGEMMVLMWDVDYAGGWLP